MKADVCPVTTSNTQLRLEVKSMMHYIKIALASCIWLFGAMATANAQGAITTIRPAPDQIATVKTAIGITTRIAFTEPIHDIICGDLYDAETGRGAFVIQRVDNDVYLKPVVPKGMSNLFVKAGAGKESTYSFDLVIVSQADAYRVVKVIAAPSATDKRSGNAPATEGRGEAASPPGDADPQKPIARSSDSNLQRKTPTPETDPANQVGDSTGAVFRDAIKRAVADYPPAARRANIHGEVVIEVSIDEAGKVTSALAVSGPAQLRESAVAAASQWEFSPLMSGSALRQDVAHITFTFLSEGGRVESFWSSIGKSSVSARGN
jgi:TonB family protein